MHITGGKNFIGLIIKKTEIFGNSGKTQVEILFDTGARRSVIRKDIAKKVSTLIELPKPEIFGVAKKGVYFTAKEAAIVQVRINSKQMSGLFYVLEKLKRPVIIGADFLQTWSIVLIPKTETIIVRGNPEDIELFFN